MKRNSTFVDKTLIIAEFLESPVTVTLVLRPRRFGKTTNLSMLRNFLSIPIHPDNQEHRYELFKGSKIEIQEPVLFKEYFCKYPVMYLSLKV